MALSRESSTVFRLLIYSESAGSLTISAFDDSVASVTSWVGRPISLTRSFSGDSTVFLLRRGFVNYFKFAVALTVSSRSKSTTEAWDFGCGVDMRYCASLNLSVSDSSSSMIYLRSSTILNISELSGFAVGSVASEASAMSDFCSLSNSLALLWIGVSYTVFRFFTNFGRW